MEKYTKASVNASSPIPIHAATPAGDPVTHDDLRQALGLLSGKWKLEILWLLYHRSYRFGELRNAIPDITQHMLTARLREMEANGLVTRTVFAEVPPRVEYAMTPATKALEPSIMAILEWWRSYGKSAKHVAA